VVAVDAASGAVVGAVIGGWSCTAPGPAQFDGAYQIDGLAVGHSYTVYAEALNGAVDPSQFDNAIAALCRNVVTDAGWPPLLDAWCPRWMRALRRGLVPDREKGVFIFLSFVFSVFFHEGFRIFEQSSRSLQ